MTRRACHWVFTTVKKAAVKPHFPHRIVHRVARHKVAAAWICVTVGVGAWSLPALPTPPYSELTPVYPGLAQLSGAVGPVEFFPPEAFGETPPEFFESGSPIAFFGPPDCCAPAPRTQPEQPPEQPVPAPEPGSIELLATAAAALAIIRGRRA